jgi:hypothetical protein
VVNNEHLTEALRRLRKNTSDNNVDRRLVNNILISFLSTSRADSKRFEMLNLLSTILGWDDREREKAGLQRTDPKAGGKGKAQANKPGIARKDSQGREERSAEEEAAMNEVSGLGAGAGPTGLTVDPHASSPCAVLTRHLVLLQSVRRVPAQRSLPRTAHSTRPRVRPRLATVAHAIPLLRRINALRSLALSPSFVTPRNRHVHSIRIEKQDFLI